jgi:hypothetical protein
LAQRVARDPVAVLQEGLDRYNGEVTSYTCTLYQRERLNPKGSMGPQQKLICKFMENPFSVYADTVENPVGATRALYVQGRWGDRMLVQPCGLGALLGFVLTDPRGSLARAGNLKSIDQFGFKRTAEELIRTCQAARKERILTCRLLGTDTVGGREAVVFEAKVAEPKPTGRFEFPRVRVWLDRERLLPIAVDTWDAAGVERGRYRFADVNFKANLTAKDFLPEANGMTPPKEAPATRSNGKGDMKGTTACLSR